VKKARFDGVVVPPAPYDTKQKKSDSTPASSTTRILTVHAQGIPEKLETPAPASWTNGSARRDDHARERSSDHPRGPMCPINGQKRFDHLRHNPEEPRTHFQSTIEASVKVSDLADRLLDTPISVTTRELLAASGGVRNT